ncbi:SigE family RNA polymerase sigma factor [soil metagenome]
MGDELAAATGSDGGPAIEPTTDALVAEVVALRPAAGGRGAAARRTPDFDQLFDDERRPMVRLAYLLVGSEAQAEEVVQEAFATVYVRWATLDNPGGFLRRCVVNGAKGSLRRRALERRKAPPPPDDGTDLGARELLDALATLPHTMRAVVVLRFYAGQTQQEIADTLDLRLGTVKSSLHRGLAKLREVIEP